MRAALLLMLASLAACESAEPERHPPFTGDSDEYHATVFADGQYVSVGTRYHFVNSAFDESRASDGLIAVWTDADPTQQLIVMPGSGGLSDVAFGDGRWLAVGSDYVFHTESPPDYLQVAFTAPTGGTWVPAAPPPDRVNSVAYGAGRWVAAGDNGLAHAVDAADWTPVAYTEMLWWSPSVDFLAGIFVAYGAGPALLDSTDGVTWNFFDTGLTEITSVAETEDGTVVAHGYYDCCYGEVEGAHMDFTMTRNADGDWTIIED